MRIALPTLEPAQALIVVASVCIALAGCAGTPGATPSDSSGPGDPPGAGQPSVAVQPGAPGEDARRLARSEMATEPLPHTEADVRFMQHMILHHMQAIEMSRLVPERTSRADLLFLARRIDRSQDDEIALMARWLRERGEEVPVAADDAGDRDAHAHHAAHATGDPDGPALMAGMLSEAQFAELRAARDEAFDRLFLELMIYHHEGAITMVRELFASHGAAQGTEIFQFANHVGADQQAEIDRMRGLLRRGG
jgi:uncharacterized protein (DUF305 family)